VSEDDPGQRPRLDVLVPRAPTDDGDGLHVVRLRDQAIELGELRRMQEGRPVPDSAEIVSLSPRDDAPAWDVEVLVPRRSTPPGEGRRGPPQVATEEYRRNWGATFGAPDDLN
jgi:hypothetical protein